MTLKKRPLYYPVFAIFIVALISLFSLAFYTLRNLHREEQLMTSHLTDMGLSVIGMIESSTTVGMMGMSWQKQQLQSLFEKVGQQENIVYVYLVSSDGQVVISSETRLIGLRLPGQGIDFSAMSDDKPQTALIRRDGRGAVFEVRKRFRLRNQPPHRQMMQRQMRSMGMWPDFLSGEPVIIAGMTTEVFYAARTEDTRRALGTGAVLLILALASTFFALVIRKYYAANQSLETAESFIRNVIESMGHGLIALDAAGKIVTINKKACQLLQVQEKTALSRDFTEVMQHVHCSIDKKQILDENWTEKKVRCSTDGKTTVPISLTTRRIQNPENSTSGSVILIRDLQEIEALQDRVKRSEHLASLGQMAAGIAHEVRNPLGSIRGLAQYFARKFEREPDEKKYAEAIISETDRLNRVIGDLLDFARPQEPTYQACDLAGIIDHALALVRSDLDAKKILIEREGENDIPEFAADPDLLAQAFMNLFLNAAEAMPGGGTLSIRCRYLADAGKIQVQIADTGEGIPPEALGKVFDPFFTLKKSGTGLGLALVHRIIDNHGGSIEVSSVPGRGTLFTIKLPVKP